MFLFYIVQKFYLHQVTYFPKISYLTLFHDFVLCGASDSVMSRVRTPTSLLLATVGNQKYEIEVSSSGIKFVQNFMKIGQLV
jgi:hypothetical protein